IVPGLGTIRSAPDRLREADRVGADYRVQEYMDRDVVKLGEVLLEALAVRAIGVGEHGDLASAVAAHRRDCRLERQRFPLDARKLLHPLAREVPAGLRIDRLSHYDDRGSPV